MTGICISSDYSCIEPHLWSL